MGVQLLSMLPMLLFFTALTVAVIFFIRLIIKAAQYLDLVLYEKNMAVQKSIQDTGHKSDLNNKTNARKP